MRAMPAAGRAGSRFCRIHQERAGIAVGRRQETIVCPTALGKAQASGAVEPLVPARKHFSDTITPGSTSLRSTRCCNP
jgi:hypothetical protein